MTYFVVYQKGDIVKDPMKSISFVPKTIPGVGWGGSCRVGWVMEGWGGSWGVGGHRGIGWAMEGWGGSWGWGSWRGGVGNEGVGGHAEVG